MFVCVFVEKGDPQGRRQDSWAVEGDDGTWYCAWDVFVRAPRVGAEGLKYGAGRDGQSAAWSWRLRQAKRALVGSQAGQECPWALGEVATHHQ